MAEEFDITAYCESGNATAGICEVNDDLQDLKVGINSFFLVWAVRITLVRYLSLSQCVF
jgi:hypothetical protein